MREGNRCHYKDFKIIEHFGWKIHFSYNSRQNISCRISSQLLKIGPVGQSWPAIRCGLVHLMSLVKNNE